VQYLAPEEFPDPQCVQYLIDALRDISLCIVIIRHERDFPDFSGFSCAFELRLLFG